MSIERLSYAAEWYDTLVSDCQAIMEQAKIETGIRLLRAKWELGNRILPDYHKFGRSTYGDKTQEDLATDLGLSHKARISEIVNFRRKVGSDFTKFVERFDASNLSWRKVVHEWLPMRKMGPVDPPPLPEGIFNVIYADPPWQYEFSLSERGDPERHYPTMSLEKICALNIPASEGAVLFLWATNPKLKEALQVIESWGFEYRTNMVWIKDKIGTGYYFRGQHELLLLAKKGNISPPNESDRFPSVLFSPREEHSEKPEEVYGIIEKMYPDPDYRYLELFSRNVKGREGWTCWGLEVDP